MMEEKLDDLNTPALKLNQFGSLTDVPEVYADAVNLFSNAYTFTLVLGTKNVDEQVSSVKPQVVLRLSPQLAAKLTDLLNTMIKQYETRHKMRIRPTKSVS